MKSLKFIKVNNLESGWDSKAKRELFKELKSDLYNAIEELNPTNFKVFNQCIKRVKDKFNGISNKIPYGLPDYLWNSFYVTEVIPARNECCPEETKKHNEEYRKEGERRRLLNKSSNEKSS